MSVVDPQPLSQPNAVALKVQDLVRHALSGKVRVPRFQRPFRWTESDILQLFDSIWHGYPIGSLLFWERTAPAADVSFGPVKFAAPPLDNAWFVVDGQQRLTALTGVLAAPDDATGAFELYFDLTEQRFRHRGRRTPPATWLPLRHVLQTKALLRWILEFQRHGGSEDLVDLATALGSQIRDYTVPVAVVSRVDEPTLRVIFDRMNNFGKRMHRSEVFHALHASYGEQAPRDLSDLSDGVAALGFGDMTDDTVLRTVLAARGGDPYRDFRDEFADATDRARAYEETGVALERVVRFLQAEVGIPHIRLLPYAFVVPVLARFFSLFDSPDPRTLVLLRRWAWRAFATRAGTGADSIPLTRKLVRAVTDDEHASAQALLGALSEMPEDPIDVSASRLNQSATKTNLALLSRLDPIHLETGKPVDVAELMQSGEPLLKLPGPKDYKDGLARLLLHPPVDEDALAALISEAPETTLASHLIVGRPSRNDVNAGATALLDRRADALLERLTALLIAAAEPGASDRPSLESLALPDDD